MYSDPYCSSELWVNAAYAQYSNHFNGNVEPIVDFCCGNSEDPYDGIGLENTNRCWGGDNYGCTNGIDDNGNGYIDNEDAFCGAGTREFTNCEYLFGELSYSVVNDGGACSSSCESGKRSVTSDYGNLPDGYDENDGQGISNLDLCGDSGLKCCVNDDGEENEIHTLSLCVYGEQQTYAGCTITDLTYCDNSENCYLGSLVYNAFIDGCTDQSACNFNPSATLDDGSCTYDCGESCTDTTACNYGSDSESCYYSGLDCSPDGSGIGCPTDGPDEWFDGNNLYDCSGNCIYLNACNDCVADVDADNFNCNDQGDCCDCTEVGDVYPDVCGTCGGTFEDPISCGCKKDYTDLGSESCATAWRDYGYPCRMLDAEYNWDCGGCSCYGDNCPEGNWGGWDPQWGWYASWWGAMDAPGSPVGSEVNCGWENPILWEESVNDWWITFNDQECQEDYLNPSTYDTWSCNCPWDSQPFSVNYASSPEECCEQCYGDSEPVLVSDQYGYENIGVGTTSSNPGLGFQLHYDPRCEDPSCGNNQNTYPGVGGWWVCGLCENGCTAHKSWVYSCQGGIPQTTARDEELMMLINLNFGDSRLKTPKPLF